MGRTFQNDDGTTGIYDYTSSCKGQRRRIEDIALVSHARAQSTELIRYLSARQFSHLIFTAIYDDTNVWAAWKNFWKVVV